MNSSRSRTDSAKPAQGEKIQASRGETPDERLIVVTCPSDTGTETHEHERASKKGKTTRNATLAHTNYSKTVHTGKADRPDTGSDNYPTRWTQLTCPRIKVYSKTLLYLRPQEFRAAIQWRVRSPAKPKQAGCHAASAIKPGTPTQGSSWPPNSYLFSYLRILRSIPLQTYKSSLTPHDCDHTQKHRRHRRRDRRDLHRLLPRHLCRPVTRDEDHTR